MIAGFLALVAMGLVAGMGLSRNPGKIPVKAVQVVLAVAAGSLGFVESGVGGTEQAVGCVIGKTRRYAQARADRGVARIGGARVLPRPAEPFRGTGGGGRGVLGRDAAQRR